MKLLLVSILLLAACPAFAGTATLTWDLNAPAEKVTGYKLYYGNFSGNSKKFPFLRYTTVKAPPASVTISPLQNWFFRVTAVNALQESSYSNMVALVFSSKPTGLVLKGPLIITP